MLKPNSTTDKQGYRWFSLSGQAWPLTIQGYNKTVPNNKRTRLPIFKTLERQYLTYIATIETDSEISDPQQQQEVDPVNIPAVQKLLLRWLTRLSHMNFSELQNISRTEKLMMMKTLLAPVTYTLRNMEIYFQPIPI